MSIRGINLTPYIRYIRLWLLLALLPALVAAVLAYINARHGVETYDASTTLYVQQSAQAGYGPTGLPDISTSTQLAQTYSALATQPVVEENTDRLLARQYPGYRIEDHGLSSSPQSIQQQNPLIVLTVTDTLPARAAAAANAAARAFIARIKQINQSRFAADEKSLSLQLDKETKTINRLTRQIAAYQGSAIGLSNLKAALNAHQSTYQSLLTSLEQLRLTRDATSSSVDVYSPATVPTSPNGSHPSRSALEWFFIVVLLGSAGIYGYEYLNDLPRSAEETEEAAGAPVLGTVPAVSEARFQAGLLSRRNPRSAAAEAYRLVRTNIQFIDVDRPVRTLVVTSPRAQEGKTTTASNLALVFAEGGKRTALVDGDLRRPTVHRLFEASREGGLTSLLVGGQLNGHLQSWPDNPNLAILPSGPIPPNPADLLNSERMQEALEGLRHRSDMVIIDSPPVLAVADAAILTAMADGVVLVVDPHRTHRRDIREARAAIEAVGGRILGVVMNRVKLGTGLSYRYTGYYYYGYGAETGRADESTDRPAASPAGSAGVENR